MSEYRICIRNKNTGERREVVESAPTHWLVEINLPLKEGEVVQSITLNQGKVKENAFGSYAAAGQSWVLFAVLATVILITGWLVLEPVFSNMLALSNDALKTACETGVTNCIH